MLSKFKNITFTFENCDFLTINEEHIDDLLIDDIKKSFRKIAINCITKLETAHIFAIKINANANVERYQFGQNGNENFKQMTFDRFLLNDITSVELEFEEENPADKNNTKSEKYEFNVVWTGESDYYNKSQVSIIDDNGNLYISIAKDRSVKDFFALI